MQRPDEREFLQAVLREIADLPAGVADRLLAALDAGPAERADTIRRIFEDPGDE